MKMIVSLIIVLLCVLKTIVGQELPSCTVSSTAGTTRALAGALYKPATNGAGEYFRALIVFAQFEDNHAVIDNWPEGSLPSWANEIIAAAPSTSYPNSSISHYFKVMSNNRFDFIGDIYPSIITVPSTVRYDKANDIIISQLNSLIPNFKRYDNWGNTGSTFTFSEGRGDGYLDMLIIIYRAADSRFELAGGIANLGGGTNLTTHDTVIIHKGGPNYTASGITSSCSRNRNTDSFTMAIHLAHEYGHYLFGSDHTKVSGLMIGDPHGYYGSTGAMSAWERNFLGYSNYVPIPATSGSLITLHDYVTTREAIKIPIPYNNPTSDEYIILENHERKSPWDQVIRGGALGGSYNTNTQIGRGLYAWYVKGGDYYPPDIYALTADGSWDWEYAGEAEDWPGEVLLRKTRVNNILGEGNSDRNPRLYYRDPDWHHRWHDINPLTNQWEITREVMGDETDAFNVGHNQLITPWSNPSTTRRNSTGNLEFTNISIQLCNQSSDSTILRIYSTHSAALALPPSKPQDLKAEYDTLNRAVLTWAPNSEPDVVSYKIYKATAPAEPSNGLYQLVATISQPSGPLPARLSWTDPQYNFGDNNYKAFYRIEAVDNQSPALASLKSDYAAIDYLYYLPNSIAANLTLNGHVYANRDFTVESGVTLTIKPGTVITFFSNSSLIVNGVLLAKGTAAKKIIIDFISISFSPINRILAGSGSNIDIRNAEVKNSAVGLWTTSSFVYVDSCDFHNMYKPFYLINNSYKGRIKNSYIRNSSSEAMWLNCSHLELFNNKIYNNNGEGVRTINYTDVDLSRNTIENNSVGINVATYSLARLMGYNLFRNSSWNSLYAKFNGVIEAGEGYNTFNPITGNYIRAEYNGYVYADWNYWGQPAPDPAKFYVEAGSLIDTSNYLPAEPGAGSTLLKYGKQTDLRLAFSNLMNGEYDDAEKLFRKVVKEKFNENESKLALSGLASCYRRSGKDGFKKYLNDEIKPAIKNKKDDFYRQYLELYTYCLTQDGSYDEALDNLRAIRDNYKLEIEQKKELDFQEAFINLAYKDNSGKAQTIFEKMRNDYSDKDTKFAIDGLLSAYKMGAFEAIKNGTLKRGKAGSPDFEGKHNGNIPRSYELFPNYPNPFNPATTISFAIPVQARVELKIFDVTGNEIIVFTFNSLDAGYHNLQWDGRNSVGESMPSGIYIYKLRTVSYEDGKLYEKASKMMLLK